MQQGLDSNVIVFVISSLRRGGAQTSMVRYAEEVARRGYCPTIVALADTPRSERVRVPGHLEVRLLDSAMNGPLRHVQRFRALRRIVKEKRPVLVHGSMPAASAHAILATIATKVNVVVQEQNNAEAERRTQLARAYLYLRHLRRRKSIHFAGVTDGVCLQLSRSLPAKHQVLKLSNPIDTRNWGSSKTPVDIPSAAEPGLNRPYILTVGRLVEQKRYDFLLEAYANSATHETHDLVIVGDGPKLAELRTLAERLDVGLSVSFPGESDNVADLMARADLFVLTSDYEGHPVVLLEALASGTRVIARDCPFGPSEIVDSPGLGRLVPLDASPVEYAAALDWELFRRPDQAERERIVAEITDRFSVERLTDKLLCFVGLPGYVSSN